MGNSLEKEGVFGSSGDDSGTGVATGLPPSTGIKVEVGLQLFGVARVAFVTVLDKERPNMGFEIFEALRVVSMEHQATRKESKSDS